MRSRKPDTRATMFTWRELSVCATKVGVNGIVRGATVSTLTCGGGRGGGADSLEHPAPNAAAMRAILAIAGVESERDAARWRFVMAGNQNDRRFRRVASAQ